MRITMTCTGVGLAAAFKWNVNTPDPVMSDVIRLKYSALFPGSTIKTDEIHPLAVSVLNGFADCDYFLCVRLSTELATLEPRSCLDWAYELVGDRCKGFAVPSSASKAISLVQAMLVAPATDGLPELDLLAEQCWNSGIGDDLESRLPRAVARLSWATLGFVSVETGSKYTSDRFNLRQTGVDLLSMQAGTAIQMLYCDCPDDRYIVAKTFTAAMRATPPTPGDGSPGVAK